MSSSALLWETLSGRSSSEKRPKERSGGDANRPPRLPFDKRCAGLTRAGKRCKGRIKGQSEFCSFHDPAMTADRRKRNAAMGGRSRTNLAHVPGGYLRKLNSLRAVGDAMDRLYREVRLGLVTPEMGSVLFRILTRVLDAGLYEKKTNSAPSRRAKVVRLRPKLAELLTLEERRAWRKAVANAPSDFLRRTAQSRPQRTDSEKANGGARVAVSAAS
jgi:hypothetical protein